MMQLTCELVALTIRDIRDDGPEPGWTPLSDKELDTVVDRIEGEAGNDPLLIFAYGSLIWNPEFEPVDRSVPRLTDGTGPFPSESSGGGQPATRRA